MSETTKAMRALRYEGPAKGVALSRTAPEPEAREGEAIVRPSRMLIAVGDIALASRRPDLPAITMGSEFVGVVEKASNGGGSKSRSPLLGRRVVASASIACGECDLCQRGLAAHCRARAVMGVIGRDGCFADRLAVPVRNLAVVPDDVDDDRAAFASAASSAVHAAQQIRIEGKPYITVLGDGVVALLCGQVMSRLNASVRIVGRRESRADLSAKWGVKHRPEADVGRRADQDIVVDCTGTPEGFSLAMRLVRPRGKVLLKGPIHPALSAPWMIDLSPIAVGEVEVIGSRCGQIAEGLDAIGRGGIDVLSLISRRVRLDDAAEGLRIAAQGEALGVLMEP